MDYAKPTQARAIETERRFLQAFRELLQEKAFAQTTVDEIAMRAGLHRGAFLKRFGSKKNALLTLYSQYCEKALDVVAKIHAELPQIDSVHAVCEWMSRELERIQTEDFSANRAMHEIFLEELQTDAGTKRIFLAGVDLMRAVQKRYLSDHPCTDTGAFAATQMLVTLSYNQVIKATPAMPTNPQVRHRLIADCLVRALII